MIETQRRARISGWDDALPPEATCDLLGGEALDVGDDSAARKDPALALQPAPKRRRQQCQEQEIRIEGMSCSRCIRVATKELEALKGVSNVEVSLEQKRATLDGRIL